MKILLTGMTSRDCNIREPRIKWVDMTGTLKYGLEQGLGANVDWREVKLGEDLSKYDLQVISIQPANALGARRGFFGTLWAMAQKKPTIIWTSDWQIHTLRTSWRNIGKRFRQQYNKVNGDEPWYFVSPEEVDPYHDLFSKLMTEFSEPWTSRHMLSPCFKWGDRSILWPRLACPPERWSFCDPSRAILQTQLAEDFSIPPWMKKREWCLATLGNHTDWLEREGIPQSWPLSHFSTNRKLKKEGVAEELAGESEVARQYAQHWGVLSPSYWSAGAGWWRARYVMAAAVGSVMYCGKKEGRSIGLPFCEQLKCIEMGDTDTLTRLAQAQHDALWPQLSSIDEWIDQIHNTVKVALAIP